MNPLSRRTRAILSVACLTGALQAAPDAVRDRVAAGFVAEVRWENVAADAYLVSGDASAPYPAPGLHGVTLEPDGFVTLHVERGSALGFVGDGGAAAIEVFRSNGSGLLHKQTGITNPATGLIEFAGSARAPTLFHLRASRQQRLRLFTRRVADVPVPHYPRRAVKPYARHVRLLNESTGRVEEFAAIGWSEPALFEIEGPALLELDVRQQFSDMDAASGDFRMRYDVSGHVLTTPVQYTRTDTAGAWRRDSQPVLLATRKRLYLDVPAGRQQIRVTATHPVLARGAILDKARYLMPQINGLAIERRLFGGAADDFEAHGVPASARRAAGSNLDPAAALGYAVAADQVGTQQAVLRWRSQLLRHRSRFVSLLPNGAEHRFEASRLGYAMPLLAAPGASETRFAIGDRHLASAADRRPMGWFVTLGGGRRLDYTMPRLTVATQLRVVADTAQANGPHRISLQYDHGIRHDILIDAGQRFPHLLQTTATSLVPAESASAIAPAHVAALDLPVPAGVATVHVIANGPPLPVSVRVRVPQVRRTRESDWQHFLDSNGDALANRWRRLLHSGRGEAGGGWQPTVAMAAADERDRELFNLWLPLMHSVIDHEAAFAQTPRLRVANLHCAANRARGRTSVARAMRLQAAGHLQAASEHWRALLPRADSETCVHAHIRIAENLGTTGEHEFARHYLATLILESENVELRRAAIRRLHNYYDEQGLRHARVRLAAFAATRAPDDANLLELFRALAGAGSQRAAIDIGLALPAARRGARLQVLLARRGWHQLLARLRRDDPAPLVHDYVAGGVRRPGPMKAGDARGLLFEDLLLGEAGSRLLAVPGSPLKTVVSGAGRMVVRLRAVVDPAAPMRDRWALVTVAGMRHVVPLFTSLARWRFRQVGDKQRFLGELAELELDPGTGPHALDVEAIGGAVAVDVAMREPWRSDRRMQAPASVGGSAVDWIAQPARRLPLGLAATLAPRPVVADRQLRRASELAFEATTTEDAERAQALTVELEAVAHGNADQRAFVRLRNRARAVSRWRRVRDVSGARGVHVTRHDRYVADGGFARSRNLFLPPWERGEYLLTGDDSHRVRIDSPVRSRIRARVSLVSAYRSRGATANVRLSIGDLQVASIPVSETATTTETVVLPSGDWIVTLATDDLPDRHAVKFALERQFADGWRPMLTTTNRRYLVSDSARPAVARIAGPAWLRIDQLDHSDRLSHYALIESGADSFAAAPQPGMRSLVRLYERIVTDAERAATADEKPVLTVESLSTSVARTLPPLPPRVLVEAGLHRPAGTWSVGGAYVETNGADEDGLFTTDRYLQYGLAHRRRAAPGHFRLAELTVRGRTGEPATLGAHWRNWRRLGSTPFSLIADATAYAQPALDGGLEWAAQGWIGGRHFARVDPALTSSLQAVLFARALSQTRAGGTTDFDVFSDYKDDHRSGLRVRHRVAYQPWLDAQLFSVVSATTNELASPTLDNARLQLGWRQHFGAAQMQVYGQHRYYFADDDRTRAVGRTRFGLEVRWHRWLMHQRRLMLGLRTFKDLHRDGVSVELEAWWHRGAARGLRDFHSDASWFAELLERAGFTQAGEQ